MKFVIALWRHETNTFSPIPTQLSDFRRGTGIDGPAYGEKAREACEGTNSAAAAYLDLAKEIGAEVEFVVCANAVPSGVVDKEAFESLANSIVDVASKGCDAILLDLHGAMVAEGYSDAEGELLRRLREVVSDSTPIGVALDFHANFGENLIQYATVIAGYCTYPHVDVYETGERVGRSIKAILEDQAEPVILWRRLPMLTHMLKQTPSKQPMKDIMDKAMSAEREGDVMNASVFGGFPLADIPEAGLSIVIVSNKDEVEKANELLDELSIMAWDRREDFVYPTEPIKESIAYAKSLSDGPIVLVDHGDNCGAGGPTDVMAVLEETLNQGLENMVAGPFCDPETVQQLFGVGIGKEVTIQLGGKTDMPALNLKGQPLELTGVVEALTDGTYTVTGPMFTGTLLSLGPTAVLKVGSNQIVISSRPQEPYDAGLFTHANIKLEDAKYILIKSRQHFKAGFGDIAKEIVLISGPGVCSSDYDIFPFKNLQRPIYPLDKQATFKLSNV